MKIPWQRTGNWFIRALFSLGVAILYLLLLRATSVQIAPPPHPALFEYPVVNTQERCEAEGGKWVEGVPARGKPAPAPVIGQTEPTAYCQGPLRVEREQQAQQRHADFVAFFVYTIGGVISLIAALPLMRITPVAPGFLVAGVIALLMGGSHFWQFAGNIARLITVAVLLIITAAAGSYFFRERTSEPEEHERG